MSPISPVPKDPVKPTRKMVKRDRNNPRTEKLVIRFRPEELERFSAHAEAHGMTLTELCRHRLLEWEIPRPPRFIFDAKLYGELSRIAVALRNAGNNLNQLSRAHHLGFRIEQDELIQKIQELHARVNELRLQVDPIGPALLQAPKGPSREEWLSGYLAAKRGLLRHGP